MTVAPVLLIIFNRPHSTAQVFEAIRNAKPGQLFIAADGPRQNHLSDLDLCKQSREIAVNVDWDCDVRLLFQDKNLGCRLGPITAIEWFFANVEQGIILEDDCLPHQDFFRFCSDMLNFYQNDSRIFSINGSNLGYSVEDNSYTFSMFMNMWGWATWRRVARLIDYDLYYWKEMKYRKIWLYRKLHGDNLFDVDYNWILYWEERIRWILEGFETWDYQWMFHQLKHRMLSIVPASNLVTNIGFGKDATHTHDPNYPVAGLVTEPMQYPLAHPKRVKNDLKYLNEIVKTKWCIEYVREPLFHLLWRSMSKWLFKG